MHNKNKVERDIAVDLMAQATQKIIDFLAGQDLEKFLRDSKTQSAVIMQLIVIGELAKKMPETIKAKIDLPWLLMGDFRNFAVHEYFELDIKQIWDTVSRDVPDVKEKLKIYLAEKN